jgi:2-methylisocitrate lyase-like PEP mutase family enzyme
MTPAEKRTRFRHLHERPELFIMPNPWDVGSARLLATLGFPALATSSLACAVTLGRRDGAVTRDEALTHAAQIAAGVEVPVSADLENGFGLSPESAADTLRRAAELGLAGASLEDASGDATRPVIDFALAVERVQAAAEAVKALDRTFVLTARAENFLKGATHLDDTIRRLQAYERAGADVLFAPGLPDLEAVRAVCAAVTKPVNFMAGRRGEGFTVAELARAGVRRISVGPAFFRAAMSGLADAAREVRERGTFTFSAAALTVPDLYRLTDQ